MRLIGISKLVDFARSAADDLRNAVLALSAELGTANWQSDEEVRIAFPRATFTGRRVEIDLDEKNCVIVVFGYEVGVVLVEFAGLKVECNHTPRTTKGKRR